MFDDTQEKKETLLVVDDEIFNLDIIVRRLSKAGYEMVTAEDGEQAWTILEAHPTKFDAIILDRMMPKMNGIELLKKVKADTRFNALPVIMQTAAAVTEQVIEGLNAGAYYYLTKPYEGSVLLSIVQAALSDHRHNVDLQKQIQEGIRSLSFMREATFCIRTLEETRLLAGLLANACPEPSRVVLGLSELLINAVEHGNLGITYQEKSALMAKRGWSDEVERRLHLPEYCNRVVSVQFQRFPDNIKITIIDQGNGFDWEKYLVMDPSRAFDSHGRGIAMSKLLSFDHLEYIGNGNTVELTIHISQ